MRYSVVSQKDRDVGRLGDGVGMCRDGGSIIDYDTEVDGGVLTSEDVVWLYGLVPSR